MMNNFLSALKWVCFFSLFVMTACSSPSVEDGTQFASNDNGGISGTGDGNSINGSFYKGPLKINTSISVYKLDENYELIKIKELLIQGAQNGSFSLEGLDAGIYSLQASGVFYDELDAAYSEEEVAIKMLVKISGSNLTHTFHANVLSTLIHDKVIDLIKAGKSYEDAYQEASNKASDFFAPITGEFDLSKTFTQIGIKPSGTVSASTHNATESDQADSAFLIYLSSLMLQVTKQSNQTTTLDQLNTQLMEGYTASILIDSLLNKFQQAQEELDEQQVENNLENLLSEELPTLTPLVTKIDNQLLPIASQSVSTRLVTRTINSQLTRYFLFDGSSLDNSGEPVGVQNSTTTGYAYNLQVSQNNNFFIKALEFPSSNQNYISIIPSTLASGTWYWRVRKVWNNQQKSRWVTKSFVVQP